MLGQSSKKKAIQTGRFRQRGLGKWSNKHDWAEWRQNQVEEEAEALTWRSIMNRKSCATVQFWRSAISARRFKRSLWTSSKSSTTGESATVSVEQEAEEVVEHVKRITLSFGSMGCLKDK